MREQEKRLVAEAAAAEIGTGMVLGLGTGSTVAELIALLGHKVRSGATIMAVATSEATAASARAVGITLLPFAERTAIDLTIDGVDEIDPAFVAIKGAGGAMLREKIVASASRRMIAIADSSKASEALGTRPVPVEILPFARAFVLETIERLGARVTLRLEDGRWARSDQGNLLADCRFADMTEPAHLARRLSAIPGLLGHGLFLDEIDALYLACDGRVIRRERHASGTANSAA